MGPRRELTARWKNSDDEGRLIVPQDWLLTIVVLTAVLAAVAFTFLAIGKRQRDLSRRLKQLKVQQNGRPHGVSPTIDTRRRPVATPRIDDINRRAQRWLLANGLEAEPKKLLAFMGLGAVIAAGAGVASGVPTILAASAALILVPGITFVVGKRRHAAKLKLAELQFPSALGTIVRTLHSGLTLQDAMHLVAAEGHDPLRSEFTRILNDQAIGLPLPDACRRMAARLPFDAAEFFSLIVAIQAETGGSIVTALKNLTETNDARAALAEKIVIAGQEARASAAIIGSLPVLVLGVLWLVQPDFVGVLFFTLKGQIALAVAAALVLLGSLVMREMAKFDG